MKTTEYREEYGIIEWQEGFEAELDGLNIEEQLRCYAFAEHAYLTEVPYRELEKEIRGNSTALDGIGKIPENWYAVVKDGIVVGVAYDNYSYDEESAQWKITGKKAVLPYKGYVYDSTSDNNGSGYKNKEWYKYLICLPCDHTLW